MSRRGRGRNRRPAADDGWEERGGYMNAKIQKLEHQFKVDAPKEDQRESDIFSGIAIHVNGYTKPAPDVIKRLMQKHGGEFHHYYSRSKVTHIIATNLPNSKVDNLTDKKVCHPSWITDSVEAGKLLPFHDYLLYTARNKNQAGIRFDAVQDAPSVPPVTSSAATGTNANSRDSVSSATSLTRNPDAPPGASGKNRETSLLKAPGRDSKRVGDKTLINSTDKTPTRSDVSHLSAQPAGPRASKRPSPDVARGLPAAKRPSPPGMDSKHRSPSKTSDPQFVSEFYNNSRLHHLSTWGAEFRAYVNELQAQAGASFPGRDKLRRIVTERESSPARLGDNKGCLGATSPGNGAATRRRSGKPERVIMHIDMDCFFVSVGLRNRPDLKGQPVAVTHSKGQRSAKERPGADPAYEKARWLQKKLGKDQKTKTASDISVGDFDEEETPEVEEIAVDSGQGEEEEEHVLPSVEEVFVSMAEIASCSYEARKAGVKNGMLMGPARKLCPSLRTIPYDFDGYSQVSKILYDTVASYTHDIEAVSCDEMLIDCTDLLADTGALPRDFASLLRQEIADKTQCNASTGMGPSILIARLATRVAKPNGQCHVTGDQVTTFILDKPVSQLPGVGWVQTKKLKAKHINTCRDLQQVSLATLQKDLGPKTGQSLYNFCRGIDERQIKMEKERKSVSAEINYGIRFTQEWEVDKFIGELADEVANRLQKLHFKGKTITLKLKVREKNAPMETAKYLGHGICDSVTKSATLPLATDTGKIIAKECMAILRPLKILACDFRGIGIQMSRLESPLGPSGAQTGNQSILNFARVQPLVIPSSAATLPRTPGSHGKATHPARGSPGTDALADSTVLDTPERPALTDPEDVDVVPDSPEGVEMSAMVEARARRRASPPPLPMLPELSSPETSFSELLSRTPRGVGGQMTTPVRSTADRHVDLEDLYLPSPSQVDPTVLKELPKDIREQIEKAMAAKSKAKHASHSNGRALPSNSHALRRDVCPGVENPSDAAILDDEVPGCSHWSQATAKVVQDMTEATEMSCDPEIEAPELEVDFRDSPVTLADAFDALPSLSQVDPSFLDALPQELRDELEHACAREHKRHLPEMEQAAPVSEPLLHPLMRAEIRNSPSKVSPTKSPSKAKPRKSPLFKQPLGRPLGRKKKLSPKKLNFVKPRDSDTQRHLASEVNETRLNTENSLASARQALTPPKVNFCGAVTLKEVKDLLSEWICSAEVPEEDDVERVVVYFSQLVDDKNLEMVDLLLKFLHRNIWRSRGEVCQWKSGFSFILEQTQAIVKATYGGILKLPFG